MEDNQSLRQLQNQVEIIGTLKSKDLEVKTTQDGRSYMSGRIVVLSKIRDKVNEQIVKVFIMESTKLFKGIDTVRKEYKSIDEHGIEEAERIKVTAELTLNEYAGSDGVIRSYNEVKGIFFNRIGEGQREPDQADKSLASIETVVQGFKEVLDSDNLPTGAYEVQGFTVGWGNAIIELKNCVIGAELAEPFKNLYQPGSTGRLSIQLNNYAKVGEIEEPVIEEAPSHGFGSTDKVEQNVVKDYVNNLEVVGGDIPFLNTKEYTEEEISKAAKIRETKLASLEASTPPDVPVKNTGFGGEITIPPDSIPNTETTNINTDEMPDF